VGQEGVVSKLLFGRQIIKYPFHVSSILFKGIPSLFGKPNSSVWLFTEKFLLHDHVTGGFQFAQVRGKIAPCHAGLMQKKQEIGNIDNVQVSHKHVSRGFMDKPVNFVDRFLYLVTIVDYYFVPPQASWDTCVKRLLISPDLLEL
jgi:hypothetical protein